MKKLYRSRKNKIIAGVCGGVGEYFNIDPVLIRLVWGILFFIGGAGLLGYIIAWIIIPERVGEPGSVTDSEDENHVEVKTSYTPQLLIGLFLVFIGAVLLIRDWWYLDQIFRDIFRFSWKYLLPLLLIGFGIYVIVKGDKVRKSD